MTTSTNTEETTSLLSPDDEAIFARFSKPKKRVFLILVSACGLMPFVVGGTFIPAIAEVAEDLGTTVSTISLTISLSIFAICIGGLGGAAYSSFYGRRPVYLVGLPLLCIGSIGAGRSTTVAQLMASRFLQSFGAAPGLSVGTAVIGDLYRLEKRGSALGIFFGSILLGQTLAPPVGGFVARYASWRIMQFIIGAMSGVTFVSVLLFLPESSHPGTRGIERTSHKLVIINPLKPLWLLRSPNLLIVSLSGFFVLFAEYVLVIPLASTVGARYNITNPALIGAFFLPGGIGNIIGAFLSGKMSDRIIVQWRERRKGVWCPEDRLRVTLPPSLFVVPLAVLLFGLCTAYVPGPVGLGFALVCLFVNGVGRDFILGPTAAYVVDVMHDRSAEAVAAFISLRSIILSISIAAIFPLMDTLGLVRTHIFTACAACLGYLMLWSTVEYGAKMRGWVDVGYSVDDSD